MNAKDDTSMDQNLEPRQSLVRVHHNGMVGLVFKIADEWFAAGTLMKGTVGAMGSYGDLETACAAADAEADGGGPDRHQCSDRCEPWLPS